MLDATETLNPSLQTWIAAQASHQKTDTATRKGRTRETTSDRCKCRPMKARKPITKEFDFAGYGFAIAVENDASRHGQTEKVASGLTAIYHDNLVIYVGRV